MRIGMTGGIGAGKTAVAEMWRERGALIVDADAVSREVVLPGTPGIAQIRARWPAYVDAGGVLDRARLSALIFADDAQRAEMNALIHRLVRVRADALEAAAPAGVIAVHVIPLLFEWGYDATCDATVAVLAPADVRLRRAIARDGLTEDAVVARMRAQMDQDALRERVDFAIDNEGDLAALRVRADAVFARLSARAQSRGSGFLGR